MTRTDVSQSESRLAASRSTLAAAEGELEIARQAYRVAVGTLPRQPRAGAAAAALPASLDEAIAIGIERNPRIVAAQFAERAAVYDFDRARAAKGPTVALSGSVGGAARQRQNQTSRPEHAWDGNTFGQVGIEGTMPLYTGGLQRQRRPPGAGAARPAPLRAAGRGPHGHRGGGRRLDPARRGPRLDRRPPRAGRGGAHRRRGRRRGGAARGALDARRARRRPGAAAGRGRDRPGDARRVCRRLRPAAGDGPADRRAPAARGRRPTSPTSTSAGCRTDRRAATTPRAVDRIRARWERN